GRNKFPRLFSRNTKIKFLPGIVIFPQLKILKGGPAGNVYVPAFVAASPAPVLRSPVYTRMQRRVKPGTFFPPVLCNLKERPVPPVPPRLVGRILRPGRKFRKRFVGSCDHDKVPVLILQEFLHRITLLFYKMN